MRLAAKGTEPAGNRLGEVVELLDQTDQVTLNRTIGAVVLRAAKGDLSQRVPEDGRSGTSLSLIHISQGIVR